MFQPTESDDKVSFAVFAIEVEKLQLLRKFLVVKPIRIRS